MQNKIELIDLLEHSGPISAAQIARTLGVSQPTVSRLIARASTAIARLGEGPGTLYALSETILGHAALQPVHWVDRAGHVQLVGELQHLRHGRLYLGGSKLRILFTADTAQRLPWQLSPLQLQGLLVRLVQARTRLPRSLSNIRRQEVHHSANAGMIC